VSSPISAKKKDNVVGKVVVSAHKSMSHSNRLEILATTIAKKIAKNFSTAQHLKCLDVGCGDLGLSRLIQSKLPNTEWSAIDIHELPEEKKSDPIWANYRQFNGSDIPFVNDSFDVVIFADVLHHTEGMSARLLEEASRVSPLVIVKDHFEYSLYSRLMLLAMDFVGNWGYGIKLPDRYFDQKQFAAIVSDCHLECTDLEIGIDLYSHIPVLKYILRPKWQFTAKLTRKPKLR
jgi:SAM-dependent methyltransferase